jgi:hypothetical protein
MQAALQGLARPPGATMIASSFHGILNHQRELNKANPDRMWSFVIGLGIALAPIHNLWLTELLSNSKGETFFFLPAFGAVLWIMGSMLFVVKRWQKGDSWFDWAGDWKVFTPLLVVILFMGISGFLTGGSLAAKFAPLFMGFTLFAVYMAARKLGVAIFSALVPFVVMGAVIAIVLGILNPGVPASMTNGLITNYCAMVGFLIFGAVVNQGKWQWVLLVVALVGVFFVGALEGLFILIVLGVAVIARRDFSKRFFIIAGTIAALAVVWIALGYLTALYTGNNNLQTLQNLISGNLPLNYDAITTLTSGRWPPIVWALQDIRFFGHGFTLSLVGGGIVHNIPLIIIHQIGPIAGLAWLFVVVYCLVKTKWKYAWIMVLAMCCWDHYLWTQFPPYIFALIGVSTASTITSDLIFKKVTQGEVMSKLGKKGGNIQIIRGDKGSGMGLFSTVMAYKLLKYYGKRHDK